MEKHYVQIDELRLPILCIDRESQEYPARLKPLPHMPKKLYVAGSLPRDSLPSAAVVGARASSTYGRIQAFRFARFLSEAGVQVISGLAQGIDGEGHKGALEGKTPTFAVLGNGVDICYPKINRSLYHRILLTGGGILSEYPPGTPGHPGFFPARNRIISALSDVVLIVEAREKSGSLITAGYALDQGRSVYALPGPVNEALSRGCHKLIFDGAGIAYDPEVILQEWELSSGPTPQSPIPPSSNLTEDAAKVLRCLTLHPRSADALSRKTGFPPVKVSTLLVELCLMGYAREIGKRYYIRLS